MYTKNFASVLQILSFSQQSGVLQVSPFVKSDTPWHALLLLTDGMATECQVLSETGILLQNGPDALLWLTNQGELTWSLSSLKDLSSHELPFPPFQQDDRRTVGSSNTSFEDTVRQRELPAQTETALDKPTRTRTVTGELQSSYAMLSRTQRQIFNLINGRKTPEDIAELLHKTPAEVRQVIHDLSTEGFIT